MADVRRVPSSVFRVTYAGEAEQVLDVTAVGRTIGYWIPVGVAIDRRFADWLRPGEPASHEAPDDGTAPAPSSPSGASRALTPTAGMTQAAKDAVLRKVAKR